MKSLSDISEYVNISIDNAFRKQNYSSSFFSDLTNSEIDKTIVSKFIVSSLGIAIKHQIDELDIYLMKGEYYSVIEESYSWMGEERIKNFREFLNNILEDAKKYAGKKRGRKPGSKRKAATADK